MKVLATLFSPQARKAQAAAVTSIAGLAAVYGFTDPSLVAAILSGIGAIGNIAAVFKLANKGK